MTKDLKPLKHRNEEYTVKQTRLPILGRKYMPLYCTNKKFKTLQIISSKNNNSTFSSDFVAG